jgi:hypothetical protein
MLTLGVALILFVAFNEKKRIVATGPAGHVSPGFWSSLGQIRQLATGLEGIADPLSGDPVGCLVNLAADPPHSTSQTRSWPSMIVPVWVTNWGVELIRPPTGATLRDRPPRGAFLISRPLAEVGYWPTTTLLLID